jgi:hypothetical protein
LNHLTIPVLGWVFLRQGPIKYLPRVVWTAILLIAASWVARITGVSHQSPAVNWFLYLFKMSLLYLIVLDVLEVLFIWS